MLTLDLSNISPFLPPGQTLSDFQPVLEAAQTALVTKNGAGNNFLGWRDLLTTPNVSLLDEVAAVAAEIRERADVLLCVGIGGSYLGAKAVIDALSPYFKRSGPEILFAGHHMSGAYLRELLQSLEGKSVYVNVISKSGTTLEPALAFRFLLDWMDERFADANERIIATTDPASGALNQLRNSRGFRKFVIPPDVGGRFSVLTPVGLLPIAAAGIDVHALFEGARTECERLSTSENNPALQYAAVRFWLHEAGYKTDVLSVFEPKLYPIGAWWQQLYGESEGKEGKGLFPVAMQFSTDLHSLGQYMQDGQRVVAETFLMVHDDQGDISAPLLAGDLDKLNYLVGKPYTEINRKAYEGTRQAHTEGGVPNMTLWMDAITPQTLGELIYFFEHGVAIGGYLLGINPFDQPGVEAYKKEMFRLLGKP
ncbi:MAG TPA: glucose-6-phosphate isomerase, partial [Rhodothermales bacterium]|nr:glucose-6-phosphate isomerase [Bacteroidota bacterium]HRK74752.1 glucose-6-phosphate isomerase [Rhodothermales bacterium]HRR07552.1 glucose-6-phosphate isomerase [Rhodothermales bacterium]